MYIVCVNGNTAITFDDLAPSIAVPSGYNNIIWTNAYTYTTSANTTGYYTGIVSPPNTMLNGYGNPMTMATASSSLFTLYSLTVAAAWNDNLQLTVDGYNSNVLIVTNTFTLQVFTLSYLIFSGYSGLDTVIFTTSGGTQDPNVVSTGTHFAMDNICLTFT